MHPVSKDAPGTKALLLGNEAIVRGALEAGVGVATGYPGTPASEVGDTFARMTERLLWFEYSVNEKVAFEAAYGASLSGTRSICSMKHLGLNVAADPLVTSAYVGVRGGFVIVSAADPGCHTSPNEQDHRYLARMSYIPVFDPRDPAEALAMTRAAFDLSEQWNVPVLMRHTTRVAHTQGVVTLGELPDRPEKSAFIRNPGQYVPVPPSARRERLELIERMKAAALQVEGSPFNSLTKGSGKLGIVTSGVSHGYVLDALDDLGLTDEVWVLKLGIAWPQPPALIRELVTNCETLLVVEELEPFIEDSIKVCISETDSRPTVRGKTDGTLPVAGEYGPGLVRRAVAEVAGRPVPEPAVSVAGLDMPGRPPILCAGCPHRSSYTAVNLAVDDRAVFMNDIGCYTLGLGGALDTADLLLSMGSSLPQAGGVWAATGRKAIAFIGDSTFFHSGMTGLVNAAYNNHDLLVMVLDNHITGMTGHQPSPAMEQMGDQLSIEAVARAAGASHVVVVDPRNQKRSVQAVREAYQMDGLRVVISRAPCPVHEARTRAAPDVHYKVEHDKCSVCHITGECSTACGLGCDRSFSLVRAQKRVELRPGGAESGLAPCTASCPVNLCIQGFLASYQAGNVAESYRIIREDLPLPSVVARVCPRPCEPSCVRNNADGSVAINDVKRTVTDQVTDTQRAQVREALKADTTQTGKKVAVVGAGPAGLAAANDLAIAGHEVVILEATSRAGGLLTWAIPEFRLPRDVVQRDVDDVLALGPVLRTGQLLGRDFTVKQLLADGYDAVYLGLGAGGTSPLKLGGDEATGVFDVIDLLARVSRGERPEMGSKVVIIGGGDAAVDAARTALRLGAQASAIVYRRTRKEMPAADHEIDRAQAEGVFIEQNLMPIAIETKGGKVTGLTVRRTKMGSADASGRRRPVPVEGSDSVLQADTVIVATGQAGVDPTNLGLPGGVLVDEAGRIEADAGTGATGHAQVFAGGDASSGPSTVVRAIASGRCAARAIDAMVMGRPLGDRPLFSGPDEALSADQYDIDELPESPRMQTPRLDAAPSCSSFDEVDTGADPQSSRTEASRCLNCATCGRCDACIAAFGCPAFFRDESGNIQIDPVLCNGCGVCALICPNGAIVRVGDEP